MKGLIIIQFALLCTGIKAQVWKWAHSYGSPTQMEYASTVSTDKYGNIYVTGEMDKPSGNWFIGTGMFWKFNKDGQLQWKDTLYEDASAITDEDGNTYLAEGHRLLKYNTNGSIIWQKTCDVQFLSSIELHPDGGVITAGSIGNRGRIAKYDANGNKLWQIGNDSTFGSGTMGRSLLCNKAGEIFYSEGYNWNTDKFYVLRFDKDGNFLSSTKVAYWVQDFVIDSSNDIYIKYRDQFITKYTLNSDSLWTKLYHGGWWPGITGLAVNADDNLIVSGWYNVDLMINHVMIVNTGQQESFVMKYSKDGDIIWLAHSLMDTVRKADMYLSSMNLRGNEIVCTGQINGGESFGSYILSTPVSQYVDLLLVKLIDEPAVGIRESSRTNPHFQVFPNPSTGQFTVSLLHYPTNNSSLKVFNSAGGKVFEQVITDNSNPRILDISHLKKGSYFIQLNFQDGTETRKVLIE